SWESLPWPASIRIYFHLRTNEECNDLANLSQVSRHFHTEVFEFMKKDENRPGIKNLRLEKTSNEMEMSIGLYPSNIPFYALTTLKSGRFMRLGCSVHPILQLTLSGSTDSILMQVSGLLSSYINLANIWGDEFTHDEFSLCVDLMHKSTFGRLIVFSETLDDSTAAHILSLTSHVKEIFFSSIAAQLSDPANFVRQLASSVSSSVISLQFPSSSSSFFGLLHSFWNKFLNENLTNGSIECIRARNMEGEITKAPFVLPDTPIGWLHWFKKV
ncbi:hypothetical protein PMAYCL1PPCAC_01651, partial [Pristionchus mayeri]